jgi:hypothetical protein
MGFFNDLGVTGLSQCMMHDAMTRACDNTYRDCARDITSAHVASSQTHYRSYIGGVHRPRSPATPLGLGFMAWLRVPPSQMMPGPFLSPFNCQWLGYVPYSRYDLLELKLSVHLRQRLGSVQEEDQRGSPFPPNVCQTGNLQFSGCRPRCVSRADPCA